MQKLTQFFFLCNSALVKGPHLLLHDLQVDRNCQLITSMDEKPSVLMEKKILIRD